jgi:hypothetical protein
MAAPGAANSCDSSSRREHHLSRSAEDAEREIGRRDAIGRARAALQAAVERRTHRHHRVALMRAVDLRELACVGL